MREEYSPEQLLELREAAGLTRRKLSQLSHVSYTVIWGTEMGKSKPQAMTWKRLLRALGVSPTSKPRKQRKKVINCMKDTWVWYVPPPPPPPPKFSFEVGRVYSIRDNKYGVINAEDISPQSGTLCRFKYEGKEGIHHCFMETRGSWRRTYTDAQLIGKQIKEESECTV